MKLHVKLAASTVLVAATVAVSGAGATATPVGPLPAGPVSSITTKHGQLIAVALPKAPRKSGLVWRVARRYDTRVVRQVSEADVHGSVVAVLAVVGTGRTSIVFAQTRGDSSPRAVAAVTYNVRAF